MNAPIAWPSSLSGRFLESRNPFVHALRHRHDTVNIDKTAIVTLRPITRDTVREIALLDVAESQIGLVAPNAFSIAQAHFSPEAWFRGVYASEVPVGFAMMEDWSQVTDRAPELYDGEPYVALWRFMIDERFQRMGFGSRALTLLIAEACKREYANVMVLSFVPDGPNAEPFYARHGFINTGVVDEGEVVMKLDLAALRQRATLGDPS
jgi:diamine N-acetyltransferase